MVIVRKSLMSDVSEVVCMLIKVDKLVNQEGVIILSEIINSLYYEAVTSVEITQPNIDACT